MTKTRKTTRRAPAGKMLSDKKIELVFVRTRSKITVMILERRLKCVEHCYTLNDEAVSNTVRKDTEN